MNCLRCRMVFTPFQPTHYCRTFREGMGPFPLGLLKRCCVHLHYPCEDRIKPKKTGPLLEKETSNEWTRTYPVDAGSCIHHRNWQIAQTEFEQYRTHCRFSGARKQCTRAIARNSQWVPIPPARVYRHRPVSGGGLGT